VSLGTKREKEAVTRSAPFDHLSGTKTHMSETMKLPALARPATASAARETDPRGSLKTEATLKAAPKTASEPSSPARAGRAGKTAGKLRKKKSKKVTVAGGAASDGKVGLPARFQ
jgi:hypothetical protein